MSEVSNNLRLSGLATGLDTETMVEDLMKAEEAKVFKIEQEKQRAEWKQEAYRDVIDDINEFIDSHYNITDNTKNILSTSSYKSVETSSGSVSMIANGDATNGSFTINEITQLATAATVSSATEAKGAISGTVDLSSGATLSGQSFDVRLDGVQKTIRFTADYVNATDIADAIQTQLNDEFGTGRVTASIVDNKLQLTADNSVLQVLTTSGGTDALTTLGLTSGDQNTVNTSASLATVFGETDAVEFTINGESFSFDSTDSMSTIMKAINASDAGVTMTYNTIDDAFTLTSKTTGAGSAINIANTSGNLFGASSYINMTDIEVKNGQDAIFYLNDSGKSNPIYRSTNTFTIDGVTTTLKETSAAAITYTVQDDVGDAKDKIVSFVNDYNEMLDQLHDIFSETRDYDYNPLSDEQKEDMSETQIENWEAKAKEGLLSGDSTIRNIYNQLRNAFNSAIDGAATSFKAIGLDTGSYQSNGKITIDETTLDAALESNVQDVVDLFTKASDISYSRDLTSTQASDRFNEAGFSHRVNDILKNAVTTYRNDAGYKGTLLEKAGKKGDTTEFSSSLSKIIADIEERLDDANDDLIDKEESYWDSFTALEVAISRMNSQSEWLYSQFA